jgi:Homeodomain-like domain
MAVQTQAASIGTVFQQRSSLSDSKSSLSSKDKCENSLEEARYLQRIDREYRNAKRMHYMQHKSNYRRVVAMNAPRPSSYKKKYLKEDERYQIVQRVRSGEKQAHLAKEFGVSRAAVCYLLKHQVDILNRSVERVYG